MNYLIEVQRLQDLDIGKIVISVVYIIKLDGLLNG